MKRREWLISLCILCILAVCAAGVSGFVCMKNQPENVAAFENRFLNLTGLGLTAQDGMTLETSDRQLHLRWPAGTQPLMAQTAVQPIDHPCQQWQLDLGGGGLQNALKKERWGYRAWLELRMYAGTTLLHSARTEMPMEARRADRTRVYTVHADAQGADGWQLCIWLEPLEGTLAEGNIILKNWEVHAR